MNTKFNVDHPCSFSPLALFTGSSYMAFNIDSITGDEYFALTCLVSQAVERLRCEGPFCYDADGIYVKDSYVRNKTQNETQKNNTQKSDKYEVMIACSDISGVYDGQGYVPKLLLLRRKLGEDYTPVQVIIETIESLL